MHFEQAFKLDGQTAVITGAAAGIGLAVAELFARQGATLVLLDRDATVQQVAQRLSSGAGAQSVGLVCDVTCSDAIEAAVAQAVAVSGRLDILVNNAGVGLLAPALEATEADWDKTMAINLKAPFLLARAAARVMQRQGRGRIVNLASQASVVALERHAAYCASKAALVAMGQVLAIEWAPYGITVNAVSPTVVETALGKQAWSGAVGEAMKKKIPVGRFAQPDEIAAAILYLVSGHAGMVTGANLLIDGGYTVQ
ncbi:SDR family oxidoreductase [Verminephrobacter eiseniae]|uniref:Short-chain dehydrogenase/reductase SDR n=1 Tax=Verminephrobacter eiseniae (strain EF01-2) TaxID=391735 RepID=A1WJI6_VEREI|nr:D-threitol dehydrogenase [Verminephrobacter eiseniae]ABM57793.1 short-chain dehydrogenase/reductase SDR [Verminephrobacter eiseniae EF01-2]MCW5283400.1 D-threitol dehydrogenase [Verminephrobacter eiseniae]MCW5301109.1 D-threitol dehydrogenase [Verminephrobacter eiseniae]MCW8180822.1 D-threitol dehydrogenase [Verminephrobacter eiseniae]MCW8191097.1 D-threitol dehydrogenase [Verminephrobacter eiseniae]